MISESVNVLSQAPVPENNQIPAPIITQIPTLGYNQIAVEINTQIPQENNKIPALGYKYTNIRPTQNIFEEALSKIAFNVDGLSFDERLKQQKSASLDAYINMKKKLSNVTQISLTQPYDCNCVFCCKMCMYSYFNCCLKCCCRKVVMWKGFAKDPYTEENKGKLVLGLTEIGNICGCCGSGGICCDSGRNYELTYEPEEEPKISYSIANFFIPNKKCKECCPYCCCEREIIVTMRDQTLKPCEAGRAILKVPMCNYCEENFAFCCNCLGKLVCRCLGSHMAQVGRQTCVCLSMCNRKYVVLQDNMKQNHFYMSYKFGNVGEERMAGIFSDVTMQHPIGSVIDTYQCNRAYCLGASNYNITFPKDCDLLQKVLVIAGTMLLSNLAHTPEIYEWTTLNNTNSFFQLI